MAGCRESFSYQLSLLKKAAQIGTKERLQPSNHVHSTAVIKLQTTSPAETRGLRQLKHGSGLGVKPHVAIFRKPDNTEVLQSWTCHCSPAIFKIHKPSSELLFLEQGTYALFYTKCFYLAMYGWTVKVLENRHRTATDKSQKESFNYCNENLSLFNTTSHNLCAKRTVHLPPCC